MPIVKRKIVPCLWFDKRAEEAPFSEIERVYAA